MSDIEKVKKLREATGAGFKDCNLAIKESAGDIDKAKDDDKTKTVQELDREKLEKKFSKEDKEKLN